MSRLTATYGTAEVELEAQIDQRFTDGEALVSYQPEDVIHATVQILKAVDNKRSRELLDAINHGLRSLEVPL